ncbi:MAG TPA: DUF4922 domain-containing protein [Bacteroidales bacterium]|nr:DUF4922 domain-containing protein [Bacteroidales bacterium]
MNLLFNDNGPVNLKARVEALFDDQLKNWDLARENYRGLQKVVTKSLSFTAQLQLRVQFNPERIYSTSAKVDSASISARPCFLCPAHLPEQQKAIPFGDEYLLLVNPFPIFQRHLTIPVRQHTPQLLQGRFNDMLRLAKELEDFVVFYNGPRCGASAPDHFHFQAGNKGFMPIEQDVDKWPKTALISEYGFQVFALNDYLRHVLIFVGHDPAWLEMQAQKAIGLLSTFEPDQSEPMMNILASWDQDHWSIYLFPRKAHRPLQFFAQGDEKIMFSPASVDLGGALILPRQEDFDKIDLHSSRDMLSQVTLEKEKWEMLKNSFIKN